MFIFAHFFAGTVLGYVLERYTHDISVILFCITGAILPDLIDKPLGYILLPQALDSGRTYFHAFFLVVMLIAFVWLFLRQQGGVWSRRILSLAAGILLHQILDTMWYEPVTWFYPVLGPFQPFHYADYFGTFFWLEITSASEWIFLAASILLLYEIFSTRLDKSSQPVGHFLFRPLYYLIVLLLSILGIHSLFCAMSGVSNLMAPYIAPEGEVILSLIALSGVIAMVVAFNENHPECRLSQKQGY
jgi:membrane-bound metal-dependent hydrolase YbcI (DUF457 family)